MTGISLRMQWPASDYSVKANVMITIFGDFGQLLAKIIDDLLENQIL
jgi:hypothetical protein